MWILWTILGLILLFFLIPSSQNTKDAPLSVKPENRNKPATKGQIEYLKSMISSYYIKIDSREDPDRAIEFIRSRALKEINSGLTREKASKLIDAFKIGYQSIDKILDALNISRWEINKYL